MKKISCVSHFNIVHSKKYCEDTPERGAKKIENGHNFVDPCGSNSPQKRLFAVPQFYVALGTVITY